ncbi:MAG: Na+/H+ antiporter NhaC family protein [Lentisphaeria bacterium]|nr:Na+/H+ antiporter NhaC family protein [Lentisphaeria bacterium]
MDHLGIWGIIPPVLTIILAFVTKDVIFSLFAGIFSGALIVAGGNPIEGLMSMTDIFADSLADSWNIRIFMFIALLGPMIGMLAKTGAAIAFGEWASSKIKTRTGTLLFTWFFGLVIFIDDYFNSLTIGTVMRPITDKNRISRAKLAYILDSTAAPVCILAPISSWVVTIMSYIKTSEGFDTLGTNEFSYFIHVIPFNFYAIFAIFMVLYISLTHRDFGPMLECERRAMAGEGLYNEELYGPVSGDVEGIAVSGSNAKFFDMIVPIITLIVLAIAFFPITTWLNAIDGKTIHTFAEAFSAISLGDAFNDTDASYALMYAMVITLFLTYLYYVGRRLLSIKSAAEAIGEGFKSMVPALVVLTLAWSIGTIIKSSPADGGLGLAKYLSELVSGGTFPLWILPTIVFILSCAISFSTGTSWGTLAIMIPIVMPISISLAQATGLSGPDLVTATMAPLGAVLGGAIFGDHASPISDTTILSSTGASCPHLEHVTTQAPYAIFVAVCSIIGYLVSGITSNPWLGLLAVSVSFVVGLLFLGKKSNASSPKVTDCAN